MGVRYLVYIRLSFHLFICFPIPLNSSIKFRLIHIRIRNVSKMTTIFDFMMVFFFMYLSFPYWPFESVRIRFYNICISQYDTLDEFL